MKSLATTEINLEQFKITQIVHTQISPTNVKTLLCPVCKAPATIINFLGEFQNKSYFVTKCNDHNYFLFVIKFTNNNENTNSINVKKYNNNANYW